MILFIKGEKQMKTISFKLSENNVDLALLRGDNINTDTIIENLEESEFENVCLLTSTRCKINSESSTKTVFLNEQRLDYLVMHNRNVDLNAIKKLDNIRT